MEAILTKKDGKVSMSKSFDYLCSLLRNGTYTVKIVRKTEPRTISQNALMWLWFTCMEETTGTPKSDWHDYYCSKFLVRVVEVADKALPVVGRTSSLNTLQFSKFLDQIQADAQTEYGVTLPLPSDRYYQDFVDEYKNR